ncbi:MAG: transcriptional repressor [Planctomycetes bacterium]|nr:transcriptional repressor [Planctomycetota bacterium]MCB9902674.1 transcriptional repressor [Planctomycetota bacterium]
MSRSTQQRAAIRACLEAAPGPLLPEEVLAIAQRECPTLGQATVYRTLAALEVEGDVERVVAADGRARFEPTRGHHHHFACRSCDRVFDVEGCRSSAAALTRGLPEGFLLEGHDVWLQGLCAECAAA